MKILILGANGRTGFQATKRALEKGHQVTALVRDSSKLTLVHAHLKVVVGDVTDLAILQKAISGQDAVLSALSTTDHAQRLLYYTNVLKVMKESGVKRIIGIAGVGALQATEHLKVYETPAFPKEYIEVTQAHVRVWDAMWNSGVDFTLVCPPMIPDGERTDKYEVNEEYPTKGWSIGTGDLADFMVNELEKNKFIKKRVGISN